MRSLLFMGGGGILATNLVADAPTTLSTANEVVKILTNIVIAIITIYGLRKKMKSNPNNPK